MGATQQRHLSSDSGYEFIDVQKENNFAVMHLKRAPVNSIHRGLVCEVTDAIETLENSDDCRGLIITSAIPKIFSAGIDITQMYPLDPSIYAQFWTAFQEMWIKLYGSKLAVIAAINGHAPAGGCFLSMTCDYRIMASGSYKIGLNEVHLGILIPFWFQDLMIDTVGQREAERALQLGHMYPAQEALDVGLVDQVVDEKDVLDSAKKMMTKFVNVNYTARSKTKFYLRQARIEHLLSRKEEDTNKVVKFLALESVQKGLGKYLASLHKK